MDVGGEGRLDGLDLLGGGLLVLLHLADDLTHQAQLGLQRLHLLDHLVPAQPHTQVTVVQVPEQEAEKMTVVTKGDKVWDNKLRVTRSGIISYG